MCCIGLSFGTGAWRPNFKSLFNYETCQMILCQSITHPNLLLQRKNHLCFVQRERFGSAPEKILTPVADKSWQANFGRRRKHSAGPLMLKKVVGGLKGGETVIIICPLHGS